MKRNIILCYILSFLRTSWFWLGIWVFYYLRFTDYAGIGLVETVMIFTMTLFEIPTGAIADIFGRRNTLILSFFFMAIGQFYMGLTPNFIGLFIAIIIGNIGITLYSGTPEALAFDSLKQINQSSLYNRVIGNLNSAQLLAMTVCGIIGGFMYVIDPRLPFIANGVGCLIGFILSFWLIEPKYDSEKFSISNYFKQTTQGFRQLFGTSDLINQTIILVIIGSIMTISDEMVDSILGVEFGFAPVALGLFTAVIFAFAALASHFSEKFKFETNRQLIFLGVLIALTYLVSPWATIVVGGLSLIVRNVLRVIFLNTSSVIINNSVESKYRATAISTFNMLKNLPYVFSAYLVGSVMDNLTARSFSLILGLLLIILFVILQVLPKFNQSTVAKQ